MRREWKGKDWIEIFLGIEALVDLLFGGGIAVEWIRRFSHQLKGNRSIY